MIQATQAVEVARRTFLELLGDRPISDLTLEEVEASDDDRFWTITLGFSEPEPDSTVPLTVGMAASLGALLKKRLRRYKSFRIDAETGALRSMKDREL